MRQLIVPLCPSANTRASNILIAIAIAKFIPRPINPRRRPAPEFFDDAGTLPMWGGGGVISRGGQSAIRARGLGAIMAGRRVALGLRTKKLAQSVIQSWQFLL